MKYIGAGLGLFVALTLDNFFIFSPIVGFFLSMGLTGFGMLLGDRK